MSDARQIEADIYERLSKVIDPLTAMGLDNDDDRGGRGGFGGKRY